MRICRMDGCEKKYYAKEYCEMHYKRFRKHGDPLVILTTQKCSTNGCEEKHHARGYCKMHYMRFKRNGTPYYEVKSDEKEWRIIPGFSSYEVSECGEVRRRENSHTAKAGRILKKRQNIQDYFRIGLNGDDGKIKDRFVHRLVALAFLGNPPTEKHQVGHNDGSKTNNHYTNLRWVTVKENSEDRIIHGTDCKGDKNPKAKLSIEDVKRIREDYANGIKNITQLSSQYNVTKTTISYAIKRKSWAHI